MVHETVSVNRDSSWEAAIALAPRLNVANNLRQHFGVLHNIDPAASWIQDEANPGPFAISIGIEIELWWSHILPSELAEVLINNRWNELSDQEQSAFNSAAEPIGFPLQDLCKQTVPLGVPHTGGDGLWEFSHRPAWHFQTLVEEVNVLVKAGIVPEGKDLPLHITLGSMEPLANSQILLRALEIADGSTSQRLLTPTTQQNGWARIGAAGVRRRYAPRLELGEQTGSELRTLVFKDIEQLQLLLKRAQKGAAIISQLQQPETAWANVTQAWALFQNQFQTITGQLSAELLNWPPPYVDGTQWLAQAQRLESAGITAEVTKILDELIAASMQEN